MLLKSSLNHGRVLLLSAALFATSLLAAESLQVLTSNPKLEQGTISTQEGAILQVGRLRVQAQEVTIKDRVLHAQGDLLLIYGSLLIKGGCLSYHLDDHEGTLLHGTIVLEPYFLQAERVDFCSNGSYTLKEVSITTCPIGEDPVALVAHHACLKGHWAHAEGIGISLFGHRFFRFPSWSTDIDEWQESRVEATFAWGGFLGSIFGLRWHLFKEKHLNVSIEGLYAFGHGPGVDLQTLWRQGTQHFCTNSLLIRETSFDQPKTTWRYSFQGHYSGCFYDDRLQMKGQYDIDSDTEMDSDFGKKRFELPTAQSTQGSIHWQDDRWLSFAQARVKVNPFQTVSQQLPAWELAILPYQVAGITGQTRLRAAYLDYSYSNLNPNFSGYHTGRLEWVQSFYRPLSAGWASLLPKLSLISRYYGNNPQGEAVFQGNLVATLNAQTLIYRRFRHFRHVVQPYGYYFLMSAPFTPLSHQYIFTLQDSYNRLQYIRTGVRQYFINGCTLLGQCDVWVNTFINMHTQEKATPKIYSSFELYPTPWLIFDGQIGWNRETESFDHSNARLLWTINHNLSTSLEWRYRGPRDWRKANHENFVLESYESEEALLHSQLSDQRSTFLANLYYRIHPDWIWQFQWRNGWKRAHQPVFTEFRNILTHYIGAHCYIAVSHEHQEDDERYSFQFKFAR